MPVTNAQWDAYQEYIEAQNIYYEVVNHKAREIILQMRPDMNNNRVAETINDVMRHIQGISHNSMGAGNPIWPVIQKLNKDPEVNEAEEEYQDKYGDGFKMKDIRKVHEILNAGRVSEDEYMFLPPILRKNYKRNSVNRGSMPNWTGHGMMNPYRARNYNPYIRKSANNNSDNEEPHGGARRTRKNRRSKPKTRSKRR